MHILAYMLEKCLEKFTREIYLRNALEKCTWEMHLRNALEKCTWEMHLRNALEKCTWEMHLSWFKVKCWQALPLQGNACEKLKFLPNQRILFSACGELRNLERLYICDTWKSRYLGTLGTSVFIPKILGTAGGSHQGSAHVPQAGSSTQGS